MSSLRSRLFIPNSLFIISAISETDKRKEKREGREGGPIDREGKVGCIIMSMLKSYLLYVSF